MVIPALDQHGLLPPGIHSCTLPEIESRYAYNDRRRKIWESFNVYIRQLSSLCDEVKTIYVDGSFTTDEDDPGDVDIIVEVDSPISEAKIRGQLGQMVDRSFVKTSFETDLLWAHRTNTSQNDIRGFFQKLKLKDASKLGLPPDTKKGLLKVNL